MTAQILVVDDEPDLQALIQQKFRHLWNCFHDLGPASLSGHSGHAPLTDEGRDTVRNFNRIFGQAGTSAYLRAVAAEEAAAELWAEVAAGERRALSAASAGG